MDEEKPVFPAFPYKPYPIQLDFMNALYRSLENGGIAMLESPTGTGKTLSIICSALQWLVDRKQLQNDKPENQSGPDDEPDWMRNFVLNTETKASEKKEKRTSFRKNNFNRKEKQEAFRDIETKETKVLKSNNGFEGMDDEEFLMEEYESEGENGGKLKRKSGEDSVSSSSEDDDDDKEEQKLKVYFCSRTHSQLSQFIKELRKTKFASELTSVCLGSRKNFCINEDVLKLGTSTRINERCLELQKSRKKECCKVTKTKNLGLKGRVRRTKASSGCPMLRSRKVEKEFRSEISQQGPLDIEDLVHIGRELGTCPYYGSRNIVPKADLIVLPYQSLLSKSSRESLGLSLKDNVVIIDEAHNLADSLISMYDAKVTLSQLDCLHSHLESYLKRFQNLLGPGNRRYIQTLMVLTRAFLQILCHGKNASNAEPFCPAEGTEGSFDFSMAINEFLFSLNIDNINLVKLVYYIQESNIIHKVCGYGDKLAAEKVSASKDSDKSSDGSSLSGFQSLLDMLLSLTNKDSDGRVIVSRTRPSSEGQKGGYLKYVMLSGEKIFSEVLDQARAVILAGGTLQPIEETKERLFPSLQPDKLHFFSCGHIIPSENILPIAVSHGPSGHPFDFSYNTRTSSIMIEELGLLLCNLVTLIPEGIVVFFSSFDYEALVYNSWKESGILARIMKKKRIYREPRKSTEVKLVLKEYNDTIEELSHSDPKSHNGAILLAIVGGKISEGINFSDGMGRCIIMVGLPYPSPSDIELIERVKHIESIGCASISKTPKLSAPTQCFNGDAQAGLSILRSCKHRGKQYYENLCIKALNQSIGRAIRHINDYAAILLVDGRFSSNPTERRSSHLTSKLPQWINARLVSSTKNYGEVHRLLHQFFKFHKDKVK
nr:ATP-dependent DNA helicase DDX11 [Ipomoea batatas]